MRWWWSSTPRMSHFAPIADLELLQLAVKDTSGFLWERLDKRFLSNLLGGQCLLVQRDPALVPERPDQWFFCLGSDLDSAYMVWPADLGFLEGAADSNYFVPARCGKLVWAVVVDEGQWLGQSYVLRSPLWQRFKYPPALMSSTRAVRAFPIGPPPNLSCNVLQGKVSGTLRWGTCANCAPTLASTAWHPAKCLMFCWHW